MTSGVSDKIARRIRMDIRAGSFSGHGKLPTERALAERFGVARNTVRKAIDTLETDGLLVRHVGRGTFLASAVEKRFGASTETEFADAFDMAAPSVSSVSPRDLIEARLMIEPMVAASAAANATDADIAILDTAHQASIRAPNHDSFETNDAAIHRQLFIMTQNPLLRSFESVLASMRANADWLAAKRAAHSVELKREYTEQHGAIIEAVRDRSPNAARKAMAEHLEHVRRALLDL